MQRLVDIGFFNNSMQSVFCQKAFEFLEFSTCSSKEISMKTGTFIFQTSCQSYKLTEQFVIAEFIINRMD